MSFRKRSDGKPISDKNNGSQKIKLVGFKGFMILGVAMMLVLVVISGCQVLQSSSSTPTSTAPSIALPTEPPISTKSLTPAEPPTLTIDDIKANGVLIVAVAKNFPPFSDEDEDEDGKRVGFDIDIARLFAKRWLGDENAVEFKPIDSAQRIPILIDGDAHLTIAAMTATSERCEQVACSQIYFEDGARLLVDPSSGINSICDLDRKDVAVAAGTTGKFNIEQQAPRWCDYRVPPTVKEYTDVEEAFDAVKGGLVAAYTRDGIGLEELAKQQKEQDSPLKVVGDPFSSEPYTIAVAKENQEVLELINFTLQEMKLDGTYETLFHAWFGCERTPYPIVTDNGTPSENIIELMVSESPLVSTSCAPVIPDIHEVEAGETLFGLSARFYGSGALYECLYEANLEIIGDDPQRLEEEISLAIPERKICREPVYAYEE